MIIAVIQARISSIRYPGKVMKNVLGKPLLWYLIERLKRSKRIDKIVIATTVNKADNKIVDFAKRNNIDYFRGSEDDVLGRIYNASVNYNPDYLFRITADCPLIDPRHCDTLVNRITKEKADYVCLGQSFAEGADIAVFTFKALKESHKKASLTAEREHVTLYIHHNPDKYKRIMFENIRDDSSYRFTVDEEVDLKVVKHIINYFIKRGKIDFSYEDLVKYLKNNSNVSQLNQNIIRNEGYLKSLSYNIESNRKKYVVFRVDGSKIIGWGHVMRCIGLAEEFKKAGINSIFITKRENVNIFEKISEFGFKVEALAHKIDFYKESRLVVNIINKYQAKTLVIDLSNKRTLEDLNSFKKYIDYLRKQIKNITFIDGLNNEGILSKIKIPINIAIVPYVGAETEIFKRHSKSTYLLGSQYAVIRRELLQRSADFKPIPKKASNILVLPGGSLNKIFLSKIINALDLITVNDLHFKIISNKGIEFNQLILKKSKLRIEIIENTSAMSKLYNWADIAISASGLTMYELAYMGIPSIVISHNKMHERIIDIFLSKGSIIHLGSKQMVTSKAIALSIDNLVNNQSKRSLMSLNGRSIVDGKGAKRIISNIVMKEIL